MANEAQVIVFVDINVFAQSQIEEAMVDVGTDLSSIVKAKVKYRSGNDVAFALVVIEEKSCGNELTFLVVKCEEHIVIHEQDVLRKKPPIGEICSLDGGFPAKFELVIPVRIINNIVA